MHPILEFIHAHLDHDSFHGRMVWESVRSHDKENGFDMYLFPCTPCQSYDYPCARLREVAAYFSDEEGYDETWTPR